MRDDLPYYPLSQISVAFDTSKIRRIKKASSLQINKVTSFTTSKLVFSFEIVDVQMLTVSI